MLLFNGIKQLAQSHNRKGAQVGIEQTNLGLGAQDLDHCIMHVAPHKYTHACIHAHAHTPVHTVICTHKFNTHDAIHYRCMSSLPTKWSLLV